MSPKLEIAKRRIQRAHDTLEEGDLLIAAANVAKALPYAFESRQTSDDADGAEPGEEEVIALQMSVTAACEHVVEQQIVDEQ